MKLPSYILLSIIAILFTCNAANAQLASHQSGFYPVDSLFFTVTQTPPPGSKVEISVNCFSNTGCFKPYKTGIWLYNRNNTPNTWENQKLTMDTSAVVIALAPRGSLDKVNVIRVRIKQANGSILSDSTYFIGITGKGAPYPYTLPVVHLLVDSMDAFGPLGFYGPGVGIRNQYVRVWNYEIDQTPRYSSYIPRSRVEKAAIMQILDATGHSLLYQNCGIHTTGQDSRSWPNKSLQVVARNEYSHSTAFNTNLLGSSATNYPSLKFRSGVTGAGPAKGFGAHEVAEQILAGLKLGDVPVTPVITFLNGSYWSLSFAQPDVEDYLPPGIKSHDEVSVFKPLYFVRSAEIVNLLRNMQMDTQKIAWTSISGREEVVSTGVLLRGNKDLFLSTSKKLLSSVKNNNSSLSFEDIESIVDLDSWLTYIAAIDFGGIDNSVNKHVFMCTAPGKKMFLLMDKTIGFAQNDVKSNQWQEQILAVDTVSSNAEKMTFESILIQDILLKNKSCIEKLCLRYQDLLNTNFKPERTIPVIENLSKKFMPEYGRYWRSWNPNAGYDSTQEVAFLERMKDYCKARPDIVWQQLADQWLPAANFHLSDRKVVSVVLDSVPEGTVKVHLNSLTLTKNWQGLYYPDPALEVSMEMQNVPAGYKVVWKEFSNMPTSFNLAVQREITLTPVLQPVKKGGN